MAFKVDIKSNIQQAFHSFDGLNRKEIGRAAKRSINRTLTTLRKESVPIIQQDVRIKSTVLKQYISLVKAEGKGLLVTGSLVFQSRGLPLSLFVKGALRATPQKGVKVNKRKAVKVQIKPGKTYVVKGAFIAQTASKGLQVMKRKIGSFPRMQTTPSIGQLLLNENRNKIAATLQNRGAELFQKNFQRDLEFRVTKAFANIKAPKKFT